MKAGNQDDREAQERERLLESLAHFAAQMAVDDLADMVLVAAHLSGKASARPRLRVVMNEHDATQE